MGCDIHVYAEVRRNGVWKYLRTGVRETCFSCEGQGFNPEHEKVCSACNKEVSEHGDNGKCLFDSTVLTDPKHPPCYWCGGTAYRIEPIYHGRNYELFARLSGVRADDNVALWPDRGIPENASPKIMEISDWGKIQKNPGKWVSDWHSHGYASLAELKPVRWGSSLRGFAKSVANLGKIAKRLKAKPDELRLVWWYDN